MAINLGKRLNAVLGCISKTDAIVDIGCDHGYLPIQAVLNGVVNKVVATDISEKSLQKCKINAEKYKVFDKFEFRVGNGLDVVESNEVETVVICGLGGNEILSILQNNKDKQFSKYILAPQNNTIKLREGLEFLNKNIIIDTIVYTNKHFYDIIVAENGESKLTQRQKFWGLNSVDNADFKLYIDKQINTLNEIKLNSPQSDKINFLERVLALV